MTKHTPTPWRVLIDDCGNTVTTGFPYISASDELDITIIHPNGFKQEYWGDLPARKCIANAELIVRSVNSHYELMEALHNMIALARPHFSDEPQMLGLKLAEEALAKGKS